MVKTVKLAIPKIFQGDQKRPGRPILLIGLLVYAAAGISIGILILIGADLSLDKAILALFAVPIFLLFLPVSLAPTVFIIGYVTGTPVVSFQWGLMLLRRQFRTLIGLILIVTTIAAAASLLFLEK